MNFADLGMGEEEKLHNHFVDRKQLILATDPKNVFLVALLIVVGIL